MMSEIRVAPDGKSVAIKKTDLPDDHPMAWGVMTDTITMGGHHARESEVRDWQVLNLGEQLESNTI